MQTGIESLSVRDVANKLGVSERHIARLIQERIIPSFRIGRCRLIRQVHLTE